MTRLEERSDPIEEKKKPVDVKKKSYQPPAWEVEQIFEKAALSCFKDPQEQCIDGPLQS